MNVSTLPAGILHGESLDAVFEHAQSEGYALPAVNVVGSNSINAVLESSITHQSPVIVQVSNGGAAFIAGKHIDNSTQQASVVGALVARDHVLRVATALSLPVIMHTDHCARQLLPWVDALLAASEKSVQTAGVPLFSSHMLDLSAEPLHQNIETAKRYLERTHALGMYLEIEIGITGGEEDGVDNSGSSQDKLYSTTEDVLFAVSELSSISNRFLLAVAFGNVHGVYKPGNVSLQPKILRDAQAAVVEKTQASTDKPVKLVFHGGSGSSAADIQEAVSYGIVKFNVDTDMQWAFTHAVKTYMDDNSEYLQSQVGTAHDPDVPNKKYYDPRVWLRDGEEGITASLGSLMQTLGSAGRRV